MNSILDKFAGNGFLIGETGEDWVEYTSNISNQASVDTTEQS